MKTWSLKTKLISSFTVLTLITIAVGALGRHGIKSSDAQLKALTSQVIPSIDSLMEMKIGLQDFQIVQRTLLDTNLDVERRREVLARIPEVRKTYGSHKEAFEALPASEALAATWAEFQKNLEEWKKTNNEGFTLYEAIIGRGLMNPDEMMAAVRQFRGDHHERMALTLSGILAGKLSEGGDDPVVCAFGKWKAEFKTTNAVIGSALEQIDAHHREFHQAIGEIRSALNRNDRSEAERIFHGKMFRAAENVFVQFAAIDEESQTCREMFNRFERLVMVESLPKQIATLKTLERAEEVVLEEAGREIEKARKTTSRVTLLNIFGGILGVGMAVGLGFLLSVSISRSLGSAIESLSKGAGQIASAADQVSQSSQSMAEGASHQASSLEETSASLEEMASMTRQNADNSRQANRMAKEAAEAAQQSQAAMARMEEAITKIKASSDQTAKIIKTIDEIAFQTNLLALNAAVEAARAGEAGKGFAVVAEEVRNLARRSAEAAHNTSELIEGAVRNAENGVAVTQEVDAVLRQINDRIVKVAQLIADVSTASGEQAKGIEQVNTAVSEMDKVTQANAGNAEESAAASEQLSAQARELTDIVDQLVSLVSGGGKMEERAARMN